MDVILTVVRRFQHYNLQFRFRRGFLERIVFGYSHEGRINNKRGEGRPRVPNKRSFEDSNNVSLLDGRDAVPWSVLSL